MLILYFAQPRHPKALNGVRWSKALNAAQRCFDVGSTAVPWSARTVLWFCQQKRSFQHETWGIKLVYIAPYNLNSFFEMGWIQLTQDLGLWNQLQWEYEGDFVGDRANNVILCQITISMNWMMFQFVFQFVNKIQETECEPQKKNGYKWLQASHCTIGTGWRLGSQDFDMEWPSHINVRWTQPLQFGGASSLWIQSPSWVNPGLVG